MSAATTTVRTGVRIEAAHLTSRVGGGTPILNDVSLSVAPNELVGIIGASGAGKTTLLHALAGVKPASEGVLCYDGVSVYQHLAGFRPVLGYVPQDDIIHTELTLRRTLRYAARLRLPSSTPTQEIDRRLAETLATLGLADHADVRVSALSGGQRKRASIAVELLSDPHVFFLDEPTSGLDPATGTGLIGLLRGLAHAGTTILFTTHAVSDLSPCDRIVALAPAGHLAFDGPLSDALEYFEVRSVAEVYEKLGSEIESGEWARRWDTRRPPDPVVPADAPPPARGERPGALREWIALTSRTLETMGRNRLTLGILLGAPAIVVAMFAILFRPGAFTFADPNPSAIVMIIFWTAFGAFFFGLTYGLLQICTELPILRREHMAGQRVSTYLLSKLAVLTPFLIFVVVLMLVVLRALGRLPPEPAATYASLTLTLTLDAVAALTLGLLTSAAVKNPSQATLALPMLCFPAVLFSGAILPVHVMAPAGAAFSAIMHDRWAFEAIGHDLGVRHLLANGGSPLGPPLLATYGDAGTYAITTYWLLLLAFIVVFLSAAVFVTRRACMRTR